MRWRTCFEVAGLEVSQCGQLRRHGRTVATAYQNNGYERAHFSTDGVRKDWLVHRLVGMVWVPGYAPGLTIDHIDSDRSNNHASNLQWMTQGDNTRKANASEHVLVSPDGVAHTVVNVRQFARLHGLDHSGLSRLITTSKPSYRGWRKP